jgi:hypothetical protein
MWTKYIGQDHIYNLKNEIFHIIKPFVGINQLIHVASWFDNVTNDQQSDMKIHITQYLISHNNYIISDLNYLNDFSYCVH